MTDHEIPMHLPTSPSDLERLPSTVPVSPATTASLFTIDLSPVTTISLGSRTSQFTSPVSLHETLVMSPVSQFASPSVSVVRCDVSPFMHIFKVPANFLHLAMAIAVVSLTTDVPLLAHLLHTCRGVRAMMPIVIQAMEMTMQLALLGNHRAVVSIRQQFSRMDWVLLYEQLRAVRVIGHVIARRAAGLVLQNDTAPLFAPHGFDPSYLYCKQEDAMDAADWQHTWDLQTLFALFFHYEEGLLNTLIKCGLFCREENRETAIRYIQEHRRRLIRSNQTSHENARVLGYRGDAVLDLLQNSYWVADITHLPEDSVFYITPNIRRVTGVQVTVNPADIERLNAAATRDEDRVRIVDAR